MTPSKVVFAACEMKSRLIHSVILGTVAALLLGCSPGGKPTGETRNGSHPTAHCEFSWSVEHPGDMPNRGWLRFLDASGKKKKEIALIYDDSHKKAGAPDTVLSHEMWAFGCNPNAVTVDWNAEVEFDEEGIPSGERKNTAVLDFYSPDGNLLWSRTYVPPAGGEVAGIASQIGVANNRVFFLTRSSGSIEAAAIDSGGSERRFAVDVRNPKAHISPNGRFGWVDSMLCPCVFLDLESGQSRRFDRARGQGDIDDTGLITIRDPKSLKPLETLRLSSQTARF